MRSNLLCRWMAAAAALPLILVMTVQFMAADAGAAVTHSDVAGVVLRPSTPAAPGIRCVLTIHGVANCYTPQVKAVSPASGPASGGTVVTITGSVLEAVDAVTFGGVPADFIVNSPTQVTATAPAGSPGTVDIRLTSPSGGPSGITPADQFTYVAAPAVTGVSPAAGPADGGTTVTVTGSGFTNATAVTFGSTAAASFTVDSDTQITATAPAGSPGPADITVTTADGTSTTSPADQFTFVAAPAVTGVSPAIGTVKGGTTVILTGAGFTGATAVTFGSTAAAGFTVDSDSQITAISPAQAQGPVTVTVTTPGGTSAAVTAATYTYKPRPKITAVVPASGPATGGTTVTITGAGFTGATAVTFGKTPAAGFTVNSGGKITVISPAHTAATVAITVTTPYGTTPLVTADKYTYSAAAPTRLQLRERRAAALVTAHRRSSQG
jgi:hypothetical protein